MLENTKRLISEYNSYFCDKPGSLGTAKILVLNAQDEIQGVENHFGLMNEEPGAQKPPIGIMPKVVWYEERIRELIGAIKRYVDSGIYNDSVYGWMCELYNLYRERERHLESRGVKDAAQS